MSNPNNDNINTYLESKYGLKTGEYVILGSGTRKKSPEEIETDKMCSYLMKPLNHEESWFGLFDFNLAVAGFMSTPLFPPQNHIQNLPVLLLSLGLRAIHAADERCIKLMRDFIGDHSSEQQAELKEALSDYVEYAKQKYQDESVEKYQAVVVALGMNQ